MAYHSQGKYDQAISDYASAIALNPNDASSYYNRELAYKSQGGYDQAISDFTQAIDSILAIFQPTTTVEMLTTV